MWYDGFARGKARGQTSYIIPAWRKGDRVLHRPSGIYGELLEMQTAGGELWKFMPVGAVASQGRQAIALTVHASDLELRP